MTFHYPLNRQPVTLARQLNVSAWRNVSDCAYQRNRQAAAAGDYERAAREWKGWETASDLAHSAGQPPFPAVLPTGIVGNKLEPRWDQLLIDSDWHVAQSFGDKVLELPSYLGDAILEDQTGWREKLATYLEVNDDENRGYSYFRINTTGDLTSDLSIDCFVSDDHSDQYWTPFYAVENGKVYDCTDSTIGDCDILDSTIGWFICDLEDKELPTECRTDRYSQDYSDNPTSTLEDDVIKGSTPVWHYGWGCFVGRLKTFAYPVKMYPETATYSG